MPYGIMPSNNSLTVLSRGIRYPSCDFKWKKLRLYIRVTWPILLADVAILCSTWRELSLERSPRIRGPGGSLPIVLRLTTRSLPHSITNKWMPDGGQDANHTNSLRPIAFEIHYLQKKIINLAVSNFGNNMLCPSYINLLSLRDLSMWCKAI